MYSILAILNFFIVVVRARILVRHYNAIQIRYKRCQYPYQTRNPIQSPSAQNFLIFQFLSYGIVPQFQQINIWILYIVPLVTPLMSANSRNQVHGKCNTPSA